MQHQQLQAAHGEDWLTEGRSRGNDFRLLRQVVVGGPRTLHDQCEEMGSFSTCLSYLPSLYHLHWAFVTQKGKLRLQETWCQLLYLALV